MGRLHQKLKGFTLVEALVSCVILAIGAVVICGVARRSVESNQRGIWYEQGYRLVDECLGRAVAQKEAILTERQVQGNFDGRYPGYRYVLEIKQGETAGLYHVRAAVTWEVLGQEHIARGETLIYADSL